MEKKRELRRNKIPMEIEIKEKRDEISFVLKKLSTNFFSRKKDKISVIRKIRKKEEKV
jgi:hypothetical protein